MTCLNMSFNSKIALKFNNMNRFSNCKLLYKNTEREDILCEDYLYIFVDEMLGAINSLSIITEDMFGKVGQWQEYYLYEDDFNKRNQKRIEIMERVTLLSAAKYVLFIYKFNNEVWIEIDKVYSEFGKGDPYDYYSNFQNYRYLLVSLTNEDLQEWSDKLRFIKANIDINC